MATVFENRPAPAYTPPQEDAALHNALIKERYEKLKNAEATQLAESISEAERAPYAAPRAAASVLAPERPEKTAPAFTAPVPERTPLGNEVVHTKVDSPLFTPETLDRTIQENYYDFAPTQTPAAPVIPVQTADMPAAGELSVAQMPAAAAAAASVDAAVKESYGLNAFAVKMIAAFAALVFTLLTIIGINSYVIRQKTMRLNQLEQRKERLVEQRSELEKDILEAQSYEKILEFVREHGMILDPNP